MKKFTLTFISALTLCSSAAMAQHIHVRQNLKDMATLCIQGKKPMYVRQAVAEAKVKNARRQASAATVWKALHDENYRYSNNSWEFYSETGYHYDDKGQLTEMTLTQGDMKETTAYTYDESTGKLVRELTQFAADGKTFQNDKLHTCLYDEADPSVLLQSQYATWDETADDWKITSSESEQSVKRVLERDAQGNPTDFTEYTYNEDDGKYVKSARNFFTYEADGTLKKFVEENYSDDSGDMSISYTNMKWKDRNGMLPPSMDDWFEGKNRLESADVSMAMATTYGTIQFDGTMNVAYADNGSYKNTMTLDMSYMSMTEVMAYDVLDDNGSYAISQMMIQNDGVTADTTAYVKQVTKCDSQGREVAYEIYQLGAEGIDNLELAYGVKYDYTYDEEKNCPKEEIVSEFDAESDTDYQTLYKIVTDEFTQVAAAIRTAKADVDAAEGTVYNLKGQKMGTTLDTLPAGVYIVKTGKDTVKVFNK